MEIKKIYVCSFILYLHQLRLRDYFFDNQNKAPISPDDILNIFPIVKHIHMPTVDAAKAHRTAQTSIQKGVLNLSVFCLLWVFLGVFFEQTLYDIVWSDLQVFWIRPTSN